MVLVVLNAMFIFVSLNTLVTCLIKGLKNVKVVHFLFSFSCSCVSFYSFLFAFFLLKFCIICFGYPLLAAMEIIVFHSSVFDFSVIGSVVILFM